MEFEWKCSDNFKRNRHFNQFTFSRLDLQNICHSDSSKTLTTIGWQNVISLSLSTTELHAWSLVKCKSWLFENDSWKTYWKILRNIISSSLGCCLHVVLRLVPRRWSTRRVVRQIRSWVVIIHICQNHENQVKMSEIPKTLSFPAKFFFEFIVVLRGFSYLFLLCDGTSAFFTSIFMFTKSNWYGLFFWPN